MKFSLENLLEGAAQREVVDVDEPVAKRARTETSREVAAATAPGLAAAVSPPRPPQGGAPGASAPRPGNAAERAPAPAALPIAGPTPVSSPTAPPVATAGPSAAAPAEGAAAAGIGPKGPAPVISHRDSVILDRGLAEKLMEYASTARDRRARGGRDYADALLGILPQLFTVSLILDSSFLFQSEASCLGTDMSYFCPCRSGTTSSY